MFITTRALGIPGATQKIIDVIEETYLELVPQRVLQVSSLWKPNCVDGKLTSELAEAIQQLPITHGGGEFQRTADAASECTS